MGTDTIRQGDHSALSICQVDILLTKNVITRYPGYTRSVRRSTRMIHGKTTVDPSLLLDLRAHTTLQGELSDVRKEKELIRS